MTALEQPNLEAFVCCGVATVQAIGKHVGVVTDSLDKHLVLGACGCIGDNFAKCDLASLITGFLVFGFGYRCELTYGTAHPFVLSQFVLYPRFYIARGHILYTLPPIGQGIELALREVGLLRSVVEQVVIHIGVFLEHLVHKTLFVIGQPRSLDYV